MKTDDGVRLETCILEVPGSHIGRVIGYPNFPNFSQENATLLPSITFKQVTTVSCLHSGSASRLI